MTHWLLLIAFNADPTLPAKMPGATTATSAPTEPVEAAPIATFVSDFGSDEPELDGPASASTDPSPDLVHPTPEPLPEPPRSAPSLAEPLPSSFPLDFSVDSQPGTAASADPSVIGTPDCPSIDPPQASESPAAETTSAMIPATTQPALAASRPVVATAAVPTSTAPATSRPSDAVDPAPVQAPIIATDHAAGYIDSAMQRRIVKRFDFDERHLGNTDRTPMNWTPVFDKGRPRYLEAVFDHTLGHTAPPSYRFTLSGGSHAERYTARDIQVMPGGIYRVDGFIRPQDITHAEAVLSAYYLDYSGRRIVATTRTTPPVRGPGRSEPWQAVEITLPACPPDGRWLGLTCELRQAERRDPDRADPRPINHVDVSAQAWFDDLSIIRLPDTGLDLTTAEGGASHGVYRGDEPVVVRTRVVDTDGVGIVNTLEVLDGDDRCLSTRTLPTSARAGETLSIRLDDLPAGRYTARLTVRADDEVLVSLARPFVRLGGIDATEDGRVAPIGVILASDAVHDVDACRRLTACLRPGMVKVPMWRADMDDQRIVYSDARFNRFLDGLIAQNATPVAVLEAPPRSLMLQFPIGADGLYDILAAPPARWRPYLALPLAQLGARIRYWQLGPDIAPGEPPLEHAGKATTALANVLGELRPLVNNPAVIIPINLDTAPNARPATVTPSPNGANTPTLARAQPPTIDEPAGVSLAVSDALPSQRLPESLAATAGARYQPRWGIVERLDHARYDRRARLTEFARRLLTQLGAGVDAVFVRQPWSQHDGRIDPLDEFAVVHAISSALAGVEKPSPVWIGEGIAAWLYADASGGRGTLVAWTEGDAADTRAVAVDFGVGVRRMDLFGNTTHVVDTLSLDASPAFFVGVEPWRVRAQAAFTLDNPILSPALAAQPRNLRLVNSTPARLRGRISLTTPPRIRVEPRQVNLDLNPGEVFELPVDFQVPTNYPVGPAALRGDLRIDGAIPTTLTLRTPLSVTAGGLDVQVTATPVDGALRVLQRITNRTDRSLALRCVLVAPDRPRVSRIIPDLPPGQTVTRTFLLETAPPSARLVRTDDAVPSRGPRPTADRASPRAARISVEEIDGDLINNQVIELE